MSQNVVDIQAAPVQSKFRSYVRRGALVLIAFFFILQLIPMEQPRTDTERSGIMPVQRAGMAGELATTMQRACGDCHSNWTNWPWYNRIAPVSWMVRRDVARGRSALNFSEWPTGDAKASVAASHLLAACGKLTDGSMPPAHYRLMHSEARLSQTQMRSYCEWSQTEAKRLLSRCS